MLLNVHIVVMEQKNYMGAITWHVPSVEKSGAGFVEEIIINIILKNGIFYSEVRLNSFTVTDDTNRIINFSFGINNLTSNTTYSDFSFGYRIRRTPIVTGTLVSVPTFTTTPKLKVDCILQSGANAATCRITNIRYCDQLCGGGTKSSCFLSSDTRNNLQITLQNTQSMQTVDHFESNPVVLDNTQSYVSGLSIPFPRTNPNNYTFNQVLLKYTAINPGSNLVETISITLQVATFTTRPVTVSLVQ